MLDDIHDHEDDAQLQSHELWRYLRFVSSLGFGVCGIIVLFFILGWLADKYFSTGATGIAVLMLLGGFLSVLWSWRQVSAMMRELYRRKNEDIMKSRDNGSSHR